METNYMAYDIEKSAKRIDEILNSNNDGFSDASSIPSRDKLTYTNGYYVNVTALFVDIVGSLDMTDDHKRPTLAKMYRSFISECVAVMNGNENCKEVSINGDCIWGVFDTIKKADLDSVFGVAAKINSLIELLNYKLRKKGYSEIKVGIGMVYGRALMIKAGYSGSSLNDVVWMGDVVNSACHICNEAGRNNKKTIIVSPVIFNNLNDHNKNLLETVYINFSVFYQGNVINLNMDDWIRKNCV